MEIEAQASISSPECCHLALVSFIFLAVHLYLQTFSQKANHKISLSMPPPLFSCFSVCGLLLEAEQPAQPVPAPQEFYSKGQAASSHSCFSLTTVKSEVRAKKREILVKLMLEMLD